MLLNSVLAELAAQGRMRERTQPFEGITSRPRHCGVVFAGSETNLSWLGLPAVLVRLAPFEQRALKAVTYDVGRYIGNRDRDN